MNLDKARARRTVARCAARIARRSLGIDCVAPDPSWSQLMRARDVMTEAVATVRGDATVAEAARLMHHSGHGGLPVVDAAGGLLGIIDRLGLIRLVLPEYAEAIGDLAFLPEDFEPFEERLEEVGHMLVRDVAHPCEATVHESTPLVEVAALMVMKRAQHVPVLRDGRLVGIVGLQDVVDEIVWPHFTRSEQA
jgi:CBS domain-containing protein